MYASGPSITLTGLRFLFQTLGETDLRSLSVFNCKVRRGEFASNPPPATRYKIWICSKVVFAAIDISSTITVFNQIKLISTVFFFGQTLGVQNLQILWELIRLYVL